MANFVFPKVDLKSPNRSNRDLSHIVRTTFAPGTLVPILTMDVLPGDDIKLKLDALVESFPMIAPVLGTWKASFDVYFEPDSNLYGFMDNNERDSTKQIFNRKRHSMSIGGSLTSGQADAGDGLTRFTREWFNRHAVAAGSLLDYLGVPSGFCGTGDYTEAGVGTVTPVSFCANGLLTYYDIVRNYYVNNQEKSALQIKSISYDNSSYDKPLFEYKNVTLDALDELFKQLRIRTDGIDLKASYGSGTGSIFESVFTNYPSALSGLFLRTYKMDLLRGIMNTSSDDFKATVSVDNGSFSIETLRYMNKLQKSIDRIDITGGRFSDWMYTRWGVKPSKNVDRPIYLGSVSSVIHNQDILATATTSGASEGADDSSRLGQQAGFVVGGTRSKKGIHLRSDEYGTLQVIFSLVPYVDYSNGIQLNLLKTKFADIYDPSFSQLGYQDVLRMELTSLPNLISVAWNGSEAFPRYHFNMNGTSVVGKRVAWSEYMAMVNRNHGEFAYGQSLDYWAFNRIYNEPSSLSFPNNDDLALFSHMGAFDATTYVKPDLWNGVFADTSPNAQNFRLQVKFDIFAKRPIGKRLMPSL